MIAQQTFLRACERDTCMVLMCAVMAFSLHHCCITMQLARRDPWANDSLQYEFFSDYESFKPFET